MLTSIVSASSNITVLPKLTDGSGSPTTGQPTTSGNSPANTTNVPSTGSAQSGKGSAQSGTGSSKSGTGNTQSSTGSPKSMTKAKAQELVDSINSHMKQLQINFDFYVDKSTKSMVIKIINKNTDQVIRQIPPEYLLTLREKMAELSGLLYDKKA